MTERSFHYKLLAQVFVDGFRLGWRFHDYQSLCHKNFRMRLPLAATVLKVMNTQLTLPHFYKVLSRELLHQSQHFQLEKCRDQFGSRDIFRLLKQIVEMDGRIHG